MTQLSRAGRLRATIAGAAVVGFVAGCDDPTPDSSTVLVSEHFEVHVQAGAAMPPNVLDILEEHYRVTRAYLNFPEGKIIYSLLARISDVQRVCGVNATESLACARDNHVYTSSSLDEHELIHAYMSRAGRPAPILREGIAQGILCGGGPGYPVTIQVPPWQTALSESPTGRQDIYDAAFFFFIHLVQRFGIEMFLDYYAMAPDTLNAETFRRSFETFWGVSLEDTWQQITRSRAGLTTIGPVCPCTQVPTLSLDGSRVELPALEPWIVGDLELVPPDRVLPFPDADPGPYLVFSKDGGTELRSCWQDRNFDLRAYDLPASAGGTLTVTRLALERHYVAVGSLGAGIVSVTKGPFVAATCDAATTIAPPADASGEIGVRVAADPGALAGTAWYWRVAVSGPTRVTVSPPGPAASSAAQISACPSCDLGAPACVNIPATGGKVMLDATPPELVFRVSDAPDGYYLGIRLTLSATANP